MSKLSLQPISYEEACQFIRTWHRHHLPPTGWKFGVAVNDGVSVVGVATVGRPVARHLDDGWTLEINRCCVCPDWAERARIAAANGERLGNPASMLYGACWRAAKALGYRRLISYVLASESGVSLKASGWREVGKSGGGEWGRGSRPRVNKAPTCQKTLWEAVSSHPPAAAPSHPRPPRSRARPSPARPAAGARKA